MNDSRYILIDNASGYIWGDQHDMPNFRGRALEYAAALDANLGTHGRQYSEVFWYDLAFNESGYHVYTAPELFPPVVDGRDPATIAAVAARCSYLTSIRCHSAT